MEIGCGGGYTIYRLAQRYHCEAVGIDIYHSPVWDRNTYPTLSYLCVDLSKENPLEEESFDYIISYVAWEHMKHPFEVLQQAAKLLKKNGLFFLSANLYRSAIASHLYRQIYFPYPHLLFDEDIVCEYALRKGAEQWFIDAFYHLNKLTYAQYKEYFHLLDLKVEHEKKYIKDLDYDFYNRFEDVLGYYPISDLELNFFGVYLRKTKKTIIRGHIIIHETSAKIISPENRTMRFVCNASGCELQYAWYIYKDGIRIESIEYKKDNYLDYTARDAGEYSATALVKDNSGRIKYKRTERIAL